MPYDGMAGKGKEMLFLKEGVNDGNVDGEGGKQIDGSQCARFITMTLRY